MSIHEGDDLHRHLARALQALLAGREPETADTEVLSGEAKSCIDGLSLALQNDGTQAVFKAFNALVEEWPWLGKLAAIAPSSDGSQKPKPEEEEEPRYQVHRLSYFKNLPKRDWNIEGIIRDKGTSVFFGDGGCGKSAVVLSMMLHKAYGIDWVGGRKVKRGLVVWIAAEGEDEIYPRAYGWMVRHGIDEEPNVLFIDEVVPLNHAPEVELFITRLQQQLQELEITEPITSIVIDTYAECSPGADENDTKDAKLLSAAIHRLRTTFDTHVAIIHHTNAGGKIRGSTVLRNYVNTAIQVSKHDGIIVLHCDKQRGAPEFEDIHLKMVSQLLSEDDPNDTAPVVVAAEEQMAGTPGGSETMNGVQQAILEVLSTHQRLTSGDFLRKCTKVQANGIPISDSAFYRQVNILVEKGRIAKEKEEATDQRKKPRVWYSLTV